MHRKHQRSPHLIESRHQFLHSVASLSRHGRCRQRSLEVWVAFSVTLGTAQVSSEEIEVVQGEGLQTDREWSNPDWDYSLTTVTYKKNVANLTIWTKSAMVMLITTVCLLVWAPCIFGIKCHVPAGTAAAPALWGCMRSPRETERGGAALPAPCWSRLRWQEECCCWSCCWPADALQAQIKSTGQTRGGKKRDNEF